MHTRAGVGEAPAGAVSVGATISGNIGRERGVDSVESERRRWDGSGGVGIRDEWVGLGRSDWEWVTIMMVLGLFW